MRVLVACEFSGIVRDAFAALGHDAWSCDLLPSERPGPHIIGDVRDVVYPGRRGSLHRSFDLMIAHPPCTRLANSGVRWLYKGGNSANGRDDAMWEAMYEDAAFYCQLRDAPIASKCLENPRAMIGHARRRIGKPGRLQTIHPWQFGHGESKATGLELIGLPDLVPTNIVEGRTPRVHHASPGPDRWKERSRTLPGIAAAMAAQWGEV